MEFLWLLYCYHDIINIYQGILIFLIASGACTYLSDGLMAQWILGVAIYLANLNQHPRSISWSNEECPLCGVEQRTKRPHGDWREFYLNLKTNGTLTGLFKAFKPQFHKSIHHHLHKTYISKSNKKWEMLINAYLPCNQWKRYNFATQVDREVYCIVVFPEFNH